MISNLVIFLFDSRSSTQGEEHLDNLVTAGVLFWNFHILSVIFFCAAGFILTNDLREMWGAYSIMPWEY